MNYVPKLLFNCLVGSRLYGLHNESSDFDWRGVCIPPKEYLLGLQRFDQYESPIGDSVVYPLYKWLQMLANGNLQILEAMYSTQVEFNGGGDHLFTHIESLLPHLISKRYYHVIKGYSASEYRRAIAKQQVAVKGKESLLDKINCVCSTLRAEGYVRDDVVKLLESASGQKITELTPIQNLGEKRRKLVEQYGWDIKAGCNAVRIIEEGIWLLNNGNLEFPCAFHGVKEIKQGKWAKEEFEQYFPLLMNNLDYAFEKSKLLDKPDINKMNEEYMKMIKDYL